MAQNIYDYMPFFAEYSKIPRSEHGLSAAPEWPALRAMLLERDGGLRNCRVLDLGCGFGWFCRWAAGDPDVDEGGAGLGGGAGRVHGIDISSNMLDRARSWSSASTSIPKATTAAADATKITYSQADLDTVTLPPDTYDVVYSSLALHYLVDIGRLFREIYSTLAPHGRFVFSIEHPIFTAPITPKPKWSGYSDAETGRPYWPLNSYSFEGERLTDWLLPSSPPSPPPSNSDETSTKATNNDDETSNQETNTTTTTTSTSTAPISAVRKQHRTLTTYVQQLLAAGFTLTAFDEWMPTAADLAKYPDWINVRHRPVFLLVGAEKKT